MKIRLTKSKKLLDTIFNDSKLCEVAFYNGKKPENYFEDANDQYLLLISNEDIVGTIKFQYFTPITAVCHVYIKSAYWNHHIMNGIVPEVENWFKQNSSVHKLLAMSPMSCSHIHKVAYNNGFKIEGKLTGAVYWKGQVEDLIIHAKFINRV